MSRAFAGSASPARTGWHNSRNLYNTSAFYIRRCQSSIPECLSATNAEICALKAGHFADADHPVLRKPPATLASLLFNLFIAKAVDTSGTVSPKTEQATFYPTHAIKVVSRHLAFATLTVKFQSQVWRLLVRRPESYRQRISSSPATKISTHGLHAHCCCIRL